MDLKKYNKHSNHSIVQHTPPLCYELSGERFVLQMDDGDDYILDFKSEDILEWTWKEEHSKQEKYVCLKSDDQIYLISFEVEGAIQRANHTFVIDKESMLVTRVVATVGKNKRWPYLISTDIVFGAIWQEGVEFEPFPRHSFTSDMIGTVVEWAYGSELSTTHIYFDAHFYRITYTRSRVESLEQAREEYAFNNMANLPSSDEPTEYIRIKEGVYFVIMTERNCEKVLGPQVPWRSNTHGFLQNYNSGGYVVARAFGTSTIDGVDRATNIIDGAYGYFIGPADDELKAKLTDINPFIY